MRILIKLLIAGLIVHGSWRAGMAYWDFYRFRDATQAVAQFAGGAPDGEVTARVLEAAATLHLPLEAEQVNVRRDGEHTYVSAEYVQPIEILPGYRYPWTFSVNIDAWTLVVTKPGQQKPQGR